ncbi:RNA polymerase Rpb8-domain-containing protein [Blyttiomyces helicus]|uniref:RNA polymerase Rpb8-domain-containing protein n=1 Tax=Blyttiomyces helicus TaxID=388810 RepID=A0A4P9WIU1_9FUNG|nr:RNA polymerase Rpb8-domain-containing protein [Blyttiomyces helicus]|eukprot:RKO91368.1 RNA polymerase Rpb8-domain-containing protein [Blyttiomyces helicus]
MLKVSEKHRSLGCSLREILAEPSRSYHSRPPPVASQNQRFSEMFEVTEIDPHGKKFDRVSRITAKCENVAMDLILDVNTEIYPMAEAEKFTLTLASSLALDGTTGDVSKKEAWRETPGERTLADDYEYVMYGKVYNYDDSGGTKVSVYASYGGLLMCLAGDYRQLQDISVGQHLYLLLRK